MSVAFGQDWKIEFNSGIPVYKQIINRVCSAVASGLFKPGDRLPTIRDLHEKLDVNPNTVAKAYRELELKGLIVCERGNGSYIKADGEISQPSEKEQREKLDSFYQRILGEAAGSGLTEKELMQYINERSSHECNRGTA